MLVRNAVANAQILGAKPNGTNSRVPPKASGGIEIRNVQSLATGDILVQLRHVGVTVNGNHTATIVLRNPEPVEANTANDDPSGHFMVKKFWFLKVGANYYKKWPMSQKHIEFNCNCPDFYFTWGLWVYRAGWLIGQKPPPYIRMTPPPPEGRPYRNPRQIPGPCKHVLNSISFLKWKGFIVS